MTPSQEADLDRVQYAISHLGEARELLMSIGANSQATAVRRTLRFVEKYERDLKKKWTGRK